MKMTSSLWGIVLLVTGVIILVVSCLRAPAIAVHVHIDTDNSFEGDNALAQRDAGARMTYNASYACEKPPGGAGTGGVCGVKGVGEPPVSLPAGEDWVSSRC